MAEGKWVNIPGKGRRWQQPSGELMMTKPGFGQGEFFQTRASQLLGGASNLLGSMGLGLPGGPQAAGPLGPRGVFGQPPLTGRQKMAKAWTSEGMVYSDEAGGGGFGFRTGNGKPYSQPSYKDAQGNIYDAVSGRLLYPAKSKPSTVTSPTVAPPSPGGSPAAERAYQSEASRVAQLTAQDPELQRYEAARKLAVAPGATPEQVQSAEDIGMQIWAQKYGKTLAPKVKPGQAGYDVIQHTIGIQELPPLEKRAEFTWNQATQGPAAAGLVVDPLLNPAAPGFIGGEGPPPVNFADPRFENISPEEFQKLLNQYTKR